MLSNNAVSRIRQLLENSTGNLPMISALIPQPLTKTIKSPSPHNGSDNVVMLTNSRGWQPSSATRSRKHKAEHPPENDPTHVGTA